MDLKFANHLFIGVQELKHLTESVKSKGYERIFQQSIDKYGVVKLPTDTSFNSLKVVEGSGNGLLTVNAGVAVDSNIDAIHLTSNDVDALTVPGDNTQYFVIINYDTKTKIEGTVSVTIDGAVTGIGTEFTKMMRGLPNFPTKIKLEGSVNTQEYEVASITNDTTLQLNVPTGSLVAETGLEVSIVGTFTPATAIAPADKYPMQYDSYALTLSATNTSNGTTSFVLASVVNTGAVTTITDMRSNNIFEIFSGTDGDAPITETSKVVGVTGIKFNTPKNPKDTNLMQIEWGLNSTSGNWTWNQLTSQITLTAASGGSITSIAGLASGDLNGWYVHEEDTGRKHEVLNSVIVGSDMVLTIPLPNDIGVASDLVIVPAADFIQIDMIPDPTRPYAKRLHIFPIMDGKGEVEVEAGYTYKPRYRHIRGNSITKLENINDGNYHPEINWSLVDGSGPVGATTTYTYAAGIPTVLSPLNHQDEKAGQTTNNTFTGTNVFNNNTTFNNPVTLGTYTAPSLASGVFHNTTIFGPYSAITGRVDSGDVTYTGLANGTNGKLALIQITTDSTDHLILSHDNVGSLANNRFWLASGQDKRLRAGDAILFRYDSLTSKWTEVSSSTTPDWVDISSTPLTLVGGNLGGMSVRSSNIRYRVNGTELNLMIRQEWEWDTVGVTPTVVQATLPFPVLPLGRSLITPIADQVGSINANFTGSNTGRDHRPMLIQFNATEIQLTNQYDTVSWEPTGADTITFSCNISIPLN